MKPLRLTLHADVVLAERGLERDWIERTVRTPDWIERDPQRDEIRRYFCSISARDGRFLRVAVVETAEELRIVTPFFDRDARQK